MTIKLLQIFKQFKPQRVICTLWMPGAVAIYLANKLSSISIPYSIIVHAMEIVESNETLKKRIRSKLTKLKVKTFSQAHKVICISQYTKEKVLSQKLCSPQKIEVIHNGVNPNKFKSQASPQKKDDEGPILLTVARLVPHKGIDQVLYSLPPLLRDFPKLQYWLVGSGADRERLANITKELQVEDKVRFLGAVGNEDLPGLYAQADLFILLSREDKHNVEGFGLVFLEAAACSTPSLGGRSGGIPDAILENETGWLVDPTDNSLIVDKLKSLLSQPEKLQSMGQKAYDYNLNHRTWDKVAENILQDISN
ncbi:MAG: glycosyltransferase family 4 protein [Bdellovibrionales bacterium]|nr:glycosyltransferase family 4 protein [Bdellovibrionales bacterium]